MKEIKYENIANNKILQTQITNLLADRFREAGLALSEVGYFHMCSILYTGKNIEMKLYFHPELAMVPIIQANGQKKYKIRDVFQDVMENYFFVGNVYDVVEIETISVPRYKIKENDFGNGYLFIKDKIDEREEEVVSIRCNIDLVIAAINDINLLNPGYQVQYNSIGFNKKKPIMVSASSDMYPIEISVHWDDDYEITGFYSGEAVNYLENVCNTIIEQKKAEKKIIKKASEAKNKSSKLYNAYTKYR